MNLNITSAPDSKYRLFPVAEELVPEGIKTITYKDQVFEIVDKYTFYKKSFFPTGFMKFVFGKDIDERLIWKKYNKSESLIIFICKPKDKNIFEKKLEEKSAETSKETKVPKLFS